MTDDDLSQYRVETPVVDERVSEKVIAIDEKLLQKPVKVLRAILAGNGIKADAVTLGDHSIDTLRFKGDLRIKLTAKIAKRQAAGKDIKGEVVHDEQGLFGAVDKHLQHAMSVPKIRQQIMDVALKRMDKGWAFDNKKLGFKSLDRQFVMHDPCQTCYKSGVVQCPECEGRKQVKCPICRGMREVMCPKCRGEGILHVQQGDIKCDQCRGDGRIACRDCGGDGLIKCKQCHASGQIKCKRCIGTGWITTYLIAEAEAFYTFTLDPRDVPPDAQKIMVELGSKLVERSIAEVDIVATTTPDMDQQMPKDEILVSYAGRMPWGPIRINIGDTSVGAMLYGYHGDLVDCPPFLERIGADAITRLLTAAEKPAEARTMLPHAVRARFIRDALQASMMRSRTRAIELYKNRYPHGLSDQMIRDLLVLAETATKNASRGSRLWMVLASQTLLAALAAAYYLGPGLTLVQTLLPNMWAQMAVDTTLTLILMALSYQLPRVAGAHALKNLLGNAMAADKVRKLVPKAGYLEWAAVALIPLTSGALITVAKLTATAVPAWLSLFGV